MNASGAKTTANAGTEIFIVTSVSNEIIVVRINESNE